MTDQSLAVRSGSNALAMFGERDDIKEMAERLRKMMPGTVSLSDTEALTVAQIAVAHGLDPFNGEVWPLKSDKDGQTKWYGVMVGIKGLRKCAHRQAVSENGTYWTEEPRQVPPEKYGEPATSIVYECWLRDSITMQAYGKSLHSLTDAGMPYSEAVQFVGKPPVKIGVGIATPNERSKMTIHARAKKRAEADAIKQRYDVSFAGAYTEGDQLPVEPAESEAIGETVEAEIVKPSERKSEEQILLELGY